MRLVTNTSPDEEIVKSLTELLEMARAGEISSFVAITVEKSSHRATTTIHTHPPQIPDIYYILSALAQRFLNEEHFRDVKPRKPRGV